MQDFCHTDRMHLQIFLSSIWQFVNVGESKETEINQRDIRRSAEVPGKTLFIIGEDFGCTNFYLTIIKHFEKEIAINNIKSH